MDSRPHILLIDDDRAWLEALSEYLLRKGFSVVAVNDPREAFAVLQGHDVSLIVCDFDMPGMNGLHLIRRLQRLPRKLTVLMLSNEDEPSLPTRSLASGAMALLAKTT